jgi:DnaK suppressor protein
LAQGTPGGTIPESGDRGFARERGRHGEATLEVWVNEARQALLKRRSRLQARGEQAIPRVEGVEGALSEQEHEEIQAINEALARMEDGEFGQCARCGGAIGRHRMRAVPEARYCMTCSTLAER